MVCRAESVAPHESHLGATDAAGIRIARRGHPMGSITPTTPPESVSEGLPRHTGVSVVIPVYKRLEYLPKALECVARQNHPDIELIVSDNGNNGAVLRTVIEAHYPRPFRLRQNAATVPVVEH